MRGRLLILGLTIVLAALVLSGAGCTQDLPLAPTPEPTPSAKVVDSSCVQTDARLIAYNGAGNPDVVFGVGEPILVQLHPLNAQGQILSQSCGYSTVVGWSYAGPECVPLGDLTSQSATFFCASPGFLDLTATHAGFKAVAKLRVIR